MCVSWQKRILVLLAEALKGIEKLKDFIAECQNFVFEEELYVYEYLIIAGAA